MNNRRFTMMTVLVIVLVGFTISPTVVTAEEVDSRELIGRWVKRFNGYSSYYGLIDTGRDSFKLGYVRTVTSDPKPQLRKIEATIKQGGEIFGTVTFFSEQTDIGCILPRITVPMRGRISPDKNSIEIIVYDFPYADFQSCKWDMSRSKESVITLYRD